MLTGKRFRLRVPSAVIDFSSGRPSRITVPSETTIKVVNDPGTSTLVDVLWDGRLVYLARRDVELYGEEVAEKKPVASQAARCEVCGELLSSYERCVNHYVAAARALSGALGNDFTIALNKAEKFRQSCKEAGDALADHWKTNHGWARRRSAS